MTTICSVKYNGQTAIAGDGQVTLGKSIIAKTTAKKIRRIYHDQVVIGFAGGVADAVSLQEKLQRRLTPGSRGNGPVLAERPDLAEIGSHGYCF